MQINSNLRNYMNNGNDSKHNHHITECMREPKVKKPDGASGGAPTQQHSEVNQEISTVESFQLNTNIPVQTSASDKKQGILRGMWDSLGEESKEKAEGKEGTENKITVFLHRIPQYLIGKWQPVKEKITIQAGKMLKHFKRNPKEELLSDSQGSLANSKSHGEKFTQNKRDNKGKISREAMEAAAVDNNFLLDSYSKSGEYCCLNQNLTYQKKQ